MHSRGQPRLIGQTSTLAGVPCRRLLRTLTLAALAVAGAVPPAGAQDSLPAGEDAFTIQNDCLNAPGFNADLTPNDPALSSRGSGTQRGILTFDGLGGATFNLDFLHINTAAFTGSGEATFVPKAFSGTVAGAGSYTIGASGEVTITFVDLTGTFLAGRGAGSIFVIDQLLWDGQLSPDQKTLLVSATEPVVQTETASKASRTSASATARGSG